MERSSKIPSTSKSVVFIPNKTVSEMPEQEGKLAARGKSIKINPKYSNFISKKINSGNLSSPLPVTPPAESELYSHTPANSNWSQCHQTFSREASSSPGNV